MSLAASHKLEPCRRSSCFVTSPAQPTCRHSPPPSSTARCLCLCFPILPVGTSCVRTRSAQAGSTRRGCQRSPEPPHQTFYLPESARSYLARVLPLENEEVTEEAGPSHPPLGQMMAELRHAQQPRVNVSPAAAKGRIREQELPHRYWCRRHLLPAPASTLPPASALSSGDESHPSFTTPPSQTQHFYTWYTLPGPQCSHSSWGAIISLVGLFA